MKSTVVVGGGVVATTLVALTSADVTALTALVTAIGMVIVNIIAARAAVRKEVGVAIEKIVEVGQKTDAAAVKIVEVAQKADVIGTRVDGAATAAKAESDSLRTEIAMLRAQLADQKETAKLLAQAAINKE